MRIKNKELRQRRHRKEQTIKAAERELRLKYGKKSGAASTAEKPAAKPKPAAEKPKPAEKPKKAPAKKKVTTPASELPAEAPGEVLVESAEAVADAPVVSAEEAE